MPFPLHILKMYTSTRQISPTVCVFKMVFEQMLLMAILKKYIHNEFAYPSSQR